MVRSLSVSSTSQCSKICTSSAFPHSPAGAVHWLMMECRSYLHNNNFSGVLPDIFSQMSTLEKLTLSNNSFDGTLPASLGSHPSLSILYCLQSIMKALIPRCFLILPLLENLQEVVTSSVAAGQLVSRPLSGAHLVLSSSSSSHSIIS